MIRSFEPMDSKWVWINRALQDLSFTEIQGHEPSTVDRGHKPSGWAIICRVLLDEGRIDASIGHYLIDRFCTEYIHRMAPGICDESPDRFDMFFLSTLMQVGAEDMAALYHEDLGEYDARFFNGLMRNKSRTDTEQDTEKS